jgi:Fe-S-cluster-containing dehydrogenase component/anaerobic selenocysteine-containing dehydrogenase
MNGERQIDPEFPGFANVFEHEGEVELAGDSVASLDRRRFLALSASALGLAGLAGCRRPDLEILPYAQTPENIVLGVPNYYATSMPKPGGCFPILVESNEGRPTKIEGNPKHPASLGATDVHTQASILDLYSPDRSKDVLRRDKDGKLVRKSSEEFDAFAADHFAALRKNQGEGLRFLIEDNPSPALRLLREHIKDKFPKAVWHVYEPIDRANVLAGTKLAFGQSLTPRYDCAKALRVVSLDCDFLGLDGDAVANGRGFAQLRRDPGIRHIFAEKVLISLREMNAISRSEMSTLMSRLYVVESTYTVTGTMADHRLRLPTAHVVDYAIALAKELTARAGSRKVPAQVKAALERAPSSDAVIPEEWIREVAGDLLDSSSHGQSLVLAGNRQPTLVHGLCCYINTLLESAAVNYWEVLDEGNQSIAALAKAVSAGEVKTLVVAGGNPAFNAPADLQFTPAPTTIRLGMFVDETSEQSNWHLPMAHYLESWGDAQTADGSHFSIQPLIAPLHSGRSALELFIQLSGYDNTNSYADAKTKVYKLLQESFKKQTKKEDELSFKRFIQSGVIDGPDEPFDEGIDDPSPLGKAIAEYRPVVAVSAANLEVSFHPSYTLYDGRYAWNGWLLELPDPITKLVWDNAAVISPKTARDLGIETGDVLEIAVAGTSIEIPAFILPGQAENSIALSLGWGKLRPSHVADGGGFNVYPIRRSDSLHFTTGKVAKTGARYALVTSQPHGTIPEGRMEEIIRDQSVADYAGSPEEARASHVHADDPKSRFQWGYQQSDYREAGRDMEDIKRIALQTAEDLSYPQRLDGHVQWGMVIDLNSCTGCSACVVACQAENNTPIVGKNEVKLHRTMHWISLHRYFTKTQGPVTGGVEVAPADNSPIVSQPMMCQHCEAAPCESVCPVNAAVHSPEGLNLQVYNRCIGTRYCSNNCPYKARRFNWFDFNKRRLDQLRVPTPFSEAGTPETLKMQKNPEVTVRMRGVMEKCTYCIQRIERGKIGSKVLAIKAGADKIDSPSTEGDSKKEYQQGYAIRIIDGISRIVVPDGIIHSACEQACPTGAIVFGNVRDTQSRVYKLKNAGPDYLVLGNLNTKPRTSYLPRLRNLNPRLIGKEGAQ